jgi:hypothetical protein
MELLDTHAVRLFLFKSYFQRCSIFKLQTSICSYLIFKYFGINYYNGSNDECSFYINGNVGVVS